MTDNQTTQQLTFQRPMGEWMAQHNSTLADAVTAARSMSAGRADFRTRGDMIAYQNGRFSFNPQWGEARRLRGPIVYEAGIETQAIRDLVEFLDAPGLSAKYILENDPDVANWVINHHLTRGERVLTVRADRNGGDFTIRSFGSQQYSTDLDNLEVLRAMTTAGWTNVDGTFQHVFNPNMPIQGTIGRDYMRLYLVYPQFQQHIPDMPDGGRSLYRAGLVIDNGEVRNKSFRVMPFIQRTACLNSVSYPGWEQYGKKFAHKGTKIAAMAVGEAVEAVAPLFDDESQQNLHLIIDSLAQAGMQQLGRNGSLDAIARFSKAFGVSDQDQMLLAQEANNYATTKLGVANAFTAYAQKFPANIRSEIESAAGLFIFEGHFGTLDTDTKAELSELAELEAAELR